MVEFTRIKEDDGEVRQYAWFKTAKSKEDAAAEFKTTFDYEAQKTFKMFPGVVAGPLNGEGGGE